MSFIDTLKALFGFSTKKENTEENIVVNPTPVTPVQEEVQTPIVETPVEENIVVSEPVAHTMESDMVTETPAVETPVETVVETPVMADTSISTEN